MDVTLLDAIPERVVGGTAKGSKRILDVQELIPKSISQGIRV
jgi:hypothetical protein